MINPPDLMERFCELLNITLTSRKGRITTLMTRGLILNVHSRHPPHTHTHAEPGEAAWGQDSSGLGEPRWAELDCADRKEPGAACRKLPPRRMPESSAVCLGLVLLGVVFFFFFFFLNSARPISGKQMKSRVSNRVVGLGSVIRSFAAPCNPLRRKNIYIYIRS